MFSDGDFQGFPEGFSFRQTASGTGTADCTEDGRRAMGRLAVELLPALRAANGALDAGLEINGSGVKLWIEVPSTNPGIPQLIYLTLSEDE